MGVGVGALLLDGLFQLDLGQAELAERVVGVAEPVARVGDGAARRVGGGALGVLEVEHGLGGAPAHQREATVDQPEVGVVRELQEDRVLDLLGLGDVAGGELRVEEQEPRLEVAIVLAGREAELGDRGLEIAAAQRDAATLARQPRGRRGRDVGGLVEQRARAVEIAGEHQRSRRLDHRQAVAGPGVEQLAQRIAAANGVAVVDEQHRGLALGVARREHLLRLAVGLARFLGVAEVALDAGQLEPGATGDGPRRPGGGAPEGDPRVLPASLLPQGRGVGHGQPRRRLGRVAHLEPGLRGVRIVAQEIDLGPGHQRVDVIGATGQDLVEQLGRTVEIAARDRQLAAQDAELERVGAGGQRVDRRRGAVEITGGEQAPPLHHDQGRALRPSRQTLIGGAAGLGDIAQRQGRRGLGLDQPARRALAGLHALERDPRLLRIAAGEAELGQRELRPRRLPRRHAEPLIGDRSRGLGAHGLELAAQLVGVGAHLAAGGAHASPRDRRRGMAGDQPIGLATRALGVGEALPRGLGHAQDHEARRARRLLGGAPRGGGRGLPATVGGRGVGLGQGQLGIVVCRGGVVEELARGRAVTVGDRQVRAGQHRVAAAIGPQLVHRGARAIEVVVEPRREDRAGLGQRRAVVAGRARAADRDQAITRTAPARPGVAARDGVGGLARGGDLLGQPHLADLEASEHTAADDRRGDRDPHRQHQRRPQRHAAGAR